MTRFEVNKKDGTKVARGSYNEKAPVVKGTRHVRWGRVAGIGATVALSAVFVNSIIYQNSLAGQIDNAIKLHEVTTDPDGNIQDYTNNKDTIFGVKTGNTDTFGERFTDKMNNDYDTKLSEDEEAKIYDEHKGILEASGVELNVNEQLSKDNEDRVTYTYNANDDQFLDDQYKGK